MIQQQVRVLLMCSTEWFWFAAPPGEPLSLDRFLDARRDALQWLVSQRQAFVSGCARAPAPPRHRQSPRLATSRFPLSEVLRKRIREHEKHRSRLGYLLLGAVGLLLPAGMFTLNDWDYDRDMAVLRQEALTALTACFPPGAIELVEHIDSETSFRDARGKRLFNLYLS